MNEKLMEPSQAASSNFSMLDEMVGDHLAGPAVYRASAHWERLNKLNTDWLKKDGLENFKRTVNNNYFNWMISARAPYFRKVAKSFFRSLLRRPMNIFQLITTKHIASMYHRTYASSDTRSSFFGRCIYTYYLLFLYIFVKKQDRLGLLKDIEEPVTGNPICINVGGKRISQDISNSYLEYSYIRDTLKDEFPGIRVIAEIGGGYGRLSYLFHLFHQKEDVKIVLVDLPPALFVAQWYMSTVFPTAKIMAYRNFSEFSEIQEIFDDSSICFLLPHQLEKLPPDKIDLLINVSSLHEMSRNQINHYYDLIATKCRFFYTKQYVLWENPDDKISVPAVIYPTRPNWGLMGARLNPVHEEFFEAMFRVQP